MNAIYGGRTTLAGQPANVYSSCSQGEGESEGQILILDGESTTDILRLGIPDTEVGFMIRQAYCEVFCQSTLLNIK